VTGNLENSLIVKKDIFEEEKEDFEKKIELLLKEEIVFKFLLVFCCNFIK
jgi:hypothetical protein